MNRMAMTLACALTVVWGTVLAGQVKVVEVKAVATGASTYRFDVTLEHGDTGWDHYADRWDVLGPDGTVLGSRVLYHPHVDEQPFTRSLSDVRVPAGLRQVQVRAHDSVHGDTDILYPVDLPAAP